MPANKPIYIGATPLPIDILGDALPVYHLNTGNTKTITLTTKNTVYAQTVPMAAVSETFAKWVDNDTTNSKLTVISKHKPAPTGKDIRVMIKSTASAGGSVTVSGNDVIVTPKTGEVSAAQIAAQINGSAAALALVYATYHGTGAVAITNQSDTNYYYLNGYDPGAQPVVVRIVLNYDGFIGTYPESHNTSLTASMPVAANIPIDMLLLPGQLVSAKSGTDAATCYITPFYKY